MAANSSRKTVVLKNLNSERIHEQDLQRDKCILSDLYGCTILLLGITTHAKLTKVKYTKVFIAPCDGLIRMEDCHDCVLTIASTQFEAVNCSNCTVYIYCCSSPIVTNCASFRFASFNGAYPSLLDKFNELGFTLEKNCWSNIRDSTPSVDGQGMNVPNWEIIDNSEVAEESNEMNEFFKEKVREVFYEFDRDNDSFLSVEEFNLFLKTIRAPERITHEDHLRKLFEDFGLEISRDGRVSMQEFILLYTHQGVQELKKDLSQLNIPFTVVSEWKLLPLDESPLETSVENPLMSMAHQLATIAVESDPIQEAIHKRLEKFQNSFIEASVEMESTILHEEENGEDEEDGSEYYEYPLLVNSIDISRHLRPPVEISQSDTLQGKSVAIEDMHQTNSVPLNTNRSKTNEMENFHVSKQQQQQAQNSMQSGAAYESNMDRTTLEIESLLNAAIKRGIDIPKWFMYFDPNGTGFLSAEEFEKALTGVGLGMGFGMGQMNQLPIERALDPSTLGKVVMMFRTEDGLVDYMSFFEHVKSLEGNDSSDRHSIPVQSDDDERNGGVSDDPSKVKSKPPIRDQLNSKRAVPSGRRKLKKRNMVFTNHNPQDQTLIQFEGLTTMDIEAILRNVLRRHADKYARLWRGLRMDIRAPDVPEVNEGKEDKTVKGESEASFISHHELYKIFQELDWHISITQAKNLAVRINSKEWMKSSGKENNKCGVGAGARKRSGTSGSDEEKSISEDMLLPEKSKSHSVVEGTRISSSLLRLYLRYLRLNNCLSHEDWRQEKSEHNAKAQRKRYEMFLKAINGEKHDLKSDEIQYHLAKHFKAEKEVLVEEAKNEAKKWVEYGPGKSTVYRKSREKCLILNVKCLTAKQQAQIRKEVLTERKKDLLKSFQSKQNMVHKLFCLYQRDCVTNDFQGVSPFDTWLKRRVEHLREQEPHFQRWKQAKMHQSKRERKWISDVAPAHIIQKELSQLFMNSNDSHATSKLHTNRKLREFCQRIKLPPQNDTSKSKPSQGGTAKQSKTRSFSMGSMESETYSDEYDEFENSGSEAKNVTSSASASVPESCGTSKKRNGEPKPELWWERLSVPCVRSSIDGVGGLVSRQDCVDTINEILYPLTMKGNESATKARSLFGDPSETEKFFVHQLQNSVKGKSKIESKVAELSEQEEYQNECKVTLEKTAIKKLVEEMFSAGGVYFKKDEEAEEKANEELQNKKQSIEEEMEHWRVSKSQQWKEEKKKKKKVLRQKAEQKQQRVSKAEQAFNDWLAGQRKGKYFSYNCNGFVKRPTLTKVAKPPAEWVDILNEDTHQQERNTPCGCPQNLLHQQVNDSF